MTSLQADCPRCGTKAVFFGFHGQHHFRTDDFEQNYYDLFGVCGICNRGVIFSYRTEGGGPGPLNHIGTLDAEFVVETAPVPPSTDAPRHTPENVSNFFRQGKASVDQGSWDAAGAMFRKALEVGLKAKFPEMPSDWTPYRLIEQAAKDHKLTPDLAEWAHRVRALGNHAVHGDPPFSESEAREISDFTRIVLEYLFTYPREMEIARRAAEASDAR